MRAEIIAIGSELLLGQIVNTNAKFLSQHLAEMGIPVYYHTVVGDNADRLKQAIEIAESRSSLIIFTGGLGPTKDDLTKDTIAKHIGVELELHEQAMNMIEKYFQKANRTMTENNRKQAMVLKNATILSNDYGMAPGMLYKNETHYYMLLPGPPKELEPMFMQYGRDALLNELDEQQVIKSKVLRFFGIGEAQLETEIEDIIDEQSNPTVAPLASNGEVKLRLTAKHMSEQEADKLIQALEEKIKKRIGQYLYGYNDSSLMGEVVRLLKSHNKTISIAESLTGGSFSAELTSFPGISENFFGGIVCYSNEAKKDLLHVQQNTLDSSGAISSECAAEMAVNIREKLKTDIGISFTGVAGPDPSEGKDVGTVWIGLSFKGREPYTFPLQLAGTRQSIRMRTTKYGCYYILKHFLA
ncbi:competence/damage-inducible protein A [Bacillus spongiae]|uniref:Putative competence-damage inducible protein n=1 Tax=Bacillus spongiae TaxID=2683610 RepID=A0ABU8HAD0_9BACI